MLFPIQLYCPSILLFFHTEPVTLSVYWIIQIRKSKCPEADQKHKVYLMTEVQGDSLSTQSSSKLKRSLSVFWEYHSELPQSEMSSTTHCITIVEIGSPR